MENNRRESMKLKIFKEGEEHVQEPKPVYLRLVDESKCIKLYACNSNGNTIAVLLFFDNKGVFTCADAYDILSKKGYDTSFCDWNKPEGKMVIDNMLSRKKY